MGKKVFLLIFVLCCLFALSNCAPLTRPAQKQEIKDSQQYWFNYDSTRRAGFIIFKDQDGKKVIQICAEPAPDTALESLAKMGIKIPEKDINGELSYKVIELAGRTKSVLFLREALYRLSELSINQKLSKEDIVSLYKAIVAVAGDVAKAELERAQKENKEADALLSKARKNYFDFLNKP